jgi:hypothetical protein
MLADESRSDLEHDLLPFPAEILMNGRRAVLLALVFLGLAAGAAAGPNVQLSPFETSPEIEQSEETSERRTTSISGAFEDSIRLLMIQHAVRIGTQQKTRQELTGPFFSDYRRSVRLPSQWGDTDSGLVNYVLHPGQGAAAGFIWLQNSTTGQTPFALTPAYMSSRFWATVFATVYSVQFEVGPFSEASIGNVGLRPETAGWVDHVMTPVGGFAIMLVEDALDRFVIRKLEDRTRSPFVRALLRMWLNPSRATASVAGLQAPWYRPGRPLGR